MAEKPDQAGDGYTDLILMIERCRRLAKHTADPLVRRELLELATEYEARMKPAPPSTAATTNGRLDDPRS
jgi:hypothetical protein